MQFDDYNSLITNHSITQTMNKQPERQVFKLTPFTAKLTNVQKILSELRFEIVSRTQGKCFHCKLQLFTNLSYVFSQPLKHSGVGVNVAYLSRLILLAINKIIDFIRKLCHFKYCIICISYNWYHN